MKWNNRVFPKVGETRIREGFLWLPKMASLNEEWRWFEYAIFEEHYTLHTLTNGDRVCRWETIQFLTPEKMKSKRS